MSNQHTFVDDSDEEMDNEVDQIENDFDGDEMPPEKVRELLSKKEVNNKTHEIKVAGPADATFDKTIMTKLNRKNGLYVIYFKEGGELPKELRGHFTSITEVDSAVDTYKTSRAIAAN